MVEVDNLHHKRLDLLNGQPNLRLVGYPNNTFDNSSSKEIPSTLKK